MHTGTPSTSNGYAKYQIRSSGIGRVLAEESTVFSIDDQDENHRDNNQLPNELNEKSRLVECRLDSDEEEENEDQMEDREGNIQGKTQGKKEINGVQGRSPQKVLSKENEDRKRNNKTDQSRSEKEFSRLTDEFDIEGDSASDELDLLPPIGLNTHGSSKWWKIFGCCRSRVPLKCAIL